MNPKRTSTRRINSRASAGLFAVLMALLVSNVAQAAEKLKPYVLVSNKPGSSADAIMQAKGVLTAQGFKVAGEYSPYDGAYVIAVTSKELQDVASKSEIGGFGAVQRVSVTTTENGVQVAYTNPVYMANVYRLKDDLSGVAAKLKAALGAEKEFGADGLTAAQLRKYQYKMFMPYFDEPIKLNEFPNNRQAVKQVEAGLAAHKGGVSKVYRVDLPGGQASLIGVALTDGCGGDKYIMDKIDFNELKSTAHLPYEMLIQDGKVYMLHPKFRIAQSFPDLSMLGDKSFFSIRCAPPSIEKALGAVSGVVPREDAW
jgi:hypothetical protein